MSNSGFDGSINVPGSGLGHRTPASMSNRLTADMIESESERQKATVRVLHVVVGGQYGSEAKGHVTAQLVNRQHDRGLGHRLTTVRVAGPNAGHTAYDVEGNKWSLRQVPVAVVHEETRNYLRSMVIAPGSEVDLGVLHDEVDRLREAGLLRSGNLVVSGHATLISSAHKNQEADSHLTARLGSTAKGIGAARADRIWRSAQRVMDNEYAVTSLRERGVIVDTDPIPRYHGDVIIEGTQGYGLGLHGSHYPKCTSSDCRAVDFAAMAGINPAGYETKVWVVARVFPIRVAGNSGPLANETTWDELGLEPEYTTVTHKMRRVGGEDWNLVADAVRANGGAEGGVRVALTMVDQKFPATAGKVSSEWDRETRDEVIKWLATVRTSINISVCALATGPTTMEFL